MQKHTHAERALGVIAAHYLDARRFLEQNRALLGVAASDSAQIQLNTTADFEAAPQDAADPGAAAFARFLGGSGLALFVLDCLQELQTVLGGTAALLGNDELQYLNGGQSLLERVNKRKRFVLTATDEMFAGDA